ncbi:membrane protein [Streptomyces eurocidicus]|uniref:Membrane protein n=1 Tax=Streptomyces eurocidicus TaxID=66423 RepID=A0A2N8NWD7_STREU|nr:hypothetical protein [Streptomyces eurocidicus]MBF6055522.1 hypothetical protein [Streptomyces eurocidicus]PNE33095.1 membrane protein [Streptomyces eurocidicus]
MEAGPRDRPQQPPRRGHRPVVAGGESEALTPDGPEDTGETDGAAPDATAPASFRELRPQRRLRVWQIAPIVVLAAIGSLMFAFPLAFEFGDGGPVVAMLGLLISCCAAGWGVMAARRVGYTWPGLPPRGSGTRPDWRYVASYTAVVALVVVLAVWRVARLR